MHVSTCVHARSCVCVCVFLSIYLSPSYWLLDHGEWLIYWNPLQYQSPNFGKPNLRDHYEVPLVWKRTYILHFFLAGGRFWPGEHTSHPLWRTNLPWQNNVRSTADLGLIMWSLTRHHVRKDLSYTGAWDYLPASPGLRCRGQHPLLFPAVLPSPTLTVNKNRGNILILFNIFTKATGGKIFKSHELTSKVRVCFLLDLKIQCSNLMFNQCMKIKVSRYFKSCWTI